MREQYEEGSRNTWEATAIIREGNLWYLDERIEVHGSKVLSDGAKLSVNRAKPGKLPFVGIV